MHHSKIADDKMRALLEAYPEVYWELATIRDQPLGFPGNHHRYPYRLKQDGIPFDGARVILFINEDGTVEEEELNLEQQIGPPPPPSLPPPILLPTFPTRRRMPPLRSRDDLIDLLHKEHYIDESSDLDHVIIHADHVWTFDPTTKARKLVERVIIDDHGQERVLLIDDHDQIEDRLPQARSAAPPPLPPLDPGGNGQNHHLGADSARFTLQLVSGDGFDDDWMVFSCIIGIGRYLRWLGYTGIAMETVNFDPETYKDAACFDHWSCTIHLPVRGGWRKDPSIVLHELGHGLWDMLFTPLPKTQTPDVDLDLGGIQEGFADYIAAALLSSSGVNGDTEVLIGGKVDPQTAHDYELPRKVCAAKAQQIHDQIYNLGLRWACALWEFRKEALLGGYSQRSIDEAIIQAHTRPVGIFGENDTPLSYYFHSLQERASAAGITLILAQWKQIDQRQGLTGSNP